MRGSSRVESARQARDVSALMVLHVFLILPTLLVFARSRPVLVGYPACDRESGRTIVRPLYSPAYAEASGARSCPHSARIARSRHFMDGNDSFSVSQEDFFRRAVGTGSRCAPRGSRTSPVCVGGKRLEYLFPEFGCLCYRPRLRLSIVETCRVSSFPTRTRLRESLSSLAAVTHYTRSIAATIQTDSGEHLVSSRF